jgi:hypothetical protein
MSDKPKDKSKPDERDVVSPWAILWDIMTSSLIHVYWYFERMHYFQPPDKAKRHGCLNLMMDIVHSY